MHSIFLLFVFTCFYSHVTAFRFGREIPPKVESLAGVEIKYIQQILDHNAETKSYWDQKYHINDAYWGGGKSPIFLKVGGENEIKTGWMNGGSWVYWAMMYKALLIQIEHRYYGMSRPTPDTSTEDLQKYFSSRQALGDVAYFIEQMNIANNFTKENKWILFGGSYAGNLVAWARLKYPELVTGAISSSGPLQAEADFVQYHEVVEKSLETISPGCAGELTKAIKSIQQMMKSNEDLEKLDSKLKICNGFDRNKAYDRAQFFQALTGNVDKAVQYDGQLSDNSINKVCGYMNNKSISDPLDRLIEYRKAMNLGCVYGSYDGLIAYYKTATWDKDVVKKGNRQWMFQICNEFGYFQTSGSESSLFSDTIPLDYFTQTCTDIFGPSFNPAQLDKAVADANKFYEGTDIQVKNVVFIHGSIDPWHPLGVVKNPTADDPFFLVPGISHCADMQNPESNDPPELKAARKTAEAKIKEWLSS